MILQFWLGAILLLMIAAAVFLVPFIEKNRSAQAENELSRNRLNRDLYDVRLAELDQDEAQGLVVDKQKIINELQHNLLDDINEQQENKLVKKNRWLCLPGLLALILGSTSLYCAVGSYPQLANWQNVLQRYPVLQNKLFNEPHNRPSEQDLRDIMLGLRTHLITAADDADGWLLYGRLAMVFKDAQLASNALKKAYYLAPQSVDIRLGYIQLQMQMDDEYSRRQAQVMLAELLKEQPDKLEAWSLSAFIALQKQDFRTAIQVWRKMLTLLDADSEQAVILRDSIAYAKKQMSSSTAAPEQSTTVNNAPVQSKVAPLGKTYQVEVAVSQQVRIPDNAFLFVYATPVGSAMPVAVLKMHSTHFPVMVELSDANSMMAGNKLSAHPEFIIKARIAADSSITSGLWQGQTAVIKAGEKGRIKLLISRQL